MQEDGLSVSKSTMLKTAAQADLMMMFFTASA